MRRKRTPTSPASKTNRKNNTELRKVGGSLEACSDPEYAVRLRGFFRTGPGEYGEGDIFRGIRVPQLRKIAKQFPDLSFRDLQRLLASGYHEDRLLALLILVERFEKSADKEREEVYGFYVRNLRHVNNWDLVDLSAGQIVGAWLRKGSKHPLYDWAKSEDLWERRIAIVATYHYIRHNEFDHTLRIARLLLNDDHDLIHKAVGWMLREVGKRDVDVLESFLREHRRKMPRTMLRYAIERFPEGKRLAYLRSQVPSPRG